MIWVLVEGPDDQLSVPALVDRGATRIGVRCINMQGKSNIVRRNRGFEDTVRRQFRLGATAFVLLMDGDVYYHPHSSLEEERRDMTTRARMLSEELGVPIYACWAILELESWLIAGLRPGVEYCGLRKVGRAPANTETAPQDPKRWLQDHLVIDYQPRIAQCIARNLDLVQATQRNASLLSFLGRFV
jgi:hypothetical protein